MKPRHANAVRRQYGRVEWTSDRTYVITFSVVRYCGARLKEK